MDLPLPRTFEPPLCRHELILPGCKLLSGSLFPQGSNLNQLSGFLRLWALLLLSRAPHLYLLNTEHEQGNESVQEVLIQALELET